MDEVVSTGGTPPSYPPETASTESYGFVFDDRIQRSIIAAIMVAVAVVGAPGNILVMTAVVLSKRLQTKTNAFVVNLASSDLATCLVLPFQALALLSDEWPLDAGLCSLVAVVVWVSLSCSVISLALIAFNRYYLITRPRGRYDRLFSTWMMIILLSLSWIVPVALIVLPTVFGVGRVGYSARYKVCSPDSTDPLAEVYTLLGSVIVDLPCFVVIVFCYVMIYRFVRARRELLAGYAKSGPSGGRGNATGSQSSLYMRQVQVTKNLFIVVCAFMICIVPWAVASLIPRSYPVKPWVSVLLVSNAYVNPIIYGLNHPQFKEAFRRMICCESRDTPDSAYSDERRPTANPTDGTSV